MKFCSSLGVLIITFGLGGRLTRHWERLTTTSQPLYSVVETKQRIQSPVFSRLRRPSVRRRHIMKYALLRSALLLAATVVLNRDQQTTGLRTNAANS